MDADGEAATTAAAKSNEKGGEKCPDFEPPQAVVNRIMKGVLPDSVQVTKDARSAFSRAAGVFIFYLTHCANDISKERKRSTIYASDVRFDKCFALLNFTLHSFPFNILPHFVISHYQ